MDVSKDWLCGTKDKPIYMDSLDICMKYKQVLTMVVSFQITFADDLE